MAHDPLKPPVKNGENGGKNGENLFFSHAELNSFGRALFSLYLVKNTYDTNMTIVTGPLFYPYYYFDVY